MRDINLIPQSFQQHRNKNTHLYLLSLILVIFVGSMVYSIFLNYQLSAISAENQTRQETLQKLSESAAQPGKTTTREALINTIASENPKISTLLNNIFSEKPEGLNIIRITQLESRNVIISGTAVSNRQITDYTAKLKERPGFRNLSVKFIQETAPNNYQFELQGSI